jgi:hypothetical protein
MEAAERACKVWQLSRNDAIVPPQSDRRSITSIYYILLFLISTTPAFGSASRLMSGKLVQRPTVFFATFSQCENMISIPVPGFVG